MQNNMVQHMEVSQVVDLDANSFSDTERLPIVFPSFQPAAHSQLAIQPRNATAITTWESLGIRTQILVGFLYDPI